MSTKTRRAALGLLLTSAAATGLSIFQWVELILVRRGGTAICTVNETINCETVWNSVLAEKIHELIHMPVAGLGLVWALTALVHAVRLWVRTGRNEPERPVVPALRLIALVGLLACLGFAYGSFQAHALCLTCLGTYVLVLAFALIAFVGLPGPIGVAGDELVSTLAWPAGIALAAYILLLAPGLATPRKLASESIPAAPVAGAAPIGSSGDLGLSAYLNGLSGEEKQELGKLLDAYRTAVPPMGALAFPPRTPVGDVHAPLRIVDFTDIKCPHCRHLEEALHVMRATLPAGRIAVESRYYPLDAECNPEVKPGLDTTVRCLGAKVQLCLEGAPDFAELQEKLFAEQETLTQARVLEIGSSGSVMRPALETCVASAATASRLVEDIKLAKAYQIEGTPLVLVNGRMATPFPPFLYVLAMAGGDPNAPALVSLKSPLGP